MTVFSFSVCVCVCTLIQVAVPMSACVRCAVGGRCACNHVHVCVRACAYLVDEVSNVPGVGGG